MKEYVNEESGRIQYIKRWLVDSACMEVVGMTMIEMMKKKLNLGTLVHLMNNSSASY